MTTLYEEIGGESTVKLLVTTFYQHVLSDPVLQPFFENVAVEKLQRMQLSFFRAALRANDDGVDVDLFEIHKHLNLSVEHLTRFTNHLLSTLAEIGIEESRCKKVYERIAVYSNDVLGESSVDG